MLPSEKHHRRAAGVSTAFQYVMHYAHDNISQLEDSLHVTTLPMPISAPLPHMAVTPLAICLSPGRKRKMDRVTFPLRNRVKMKEQGNHIEAEDILETVCLLHFRDPCKHF